MTNKNSIKRLAEFLPRDKRITIFNRVLASYRDKNQLFQDLKCSGKLLDKWTRKGPDDKYMFQILELAFLRCADTDGILTEMINELEGLCKWFGINSTKNKFSVFMNGLDDKSKKIIWYLLKNGHANIRELSDIIGGTDMDILARVRDIINPRAKNIFTKEIMKFENKKIDPTTGDKILFSWWLTEDFPHVESNGKMLDIFDEDDHIKVVAELPMTNEKDIKIDVGKNVIAVSANKYQRSIPLFSPVNKILEKTYKNGILEVRLAKI